MIRRIIGVVLICGLALSGCTRLGGQGQISTSTTASRIGSQAAPVTQQQPASTAKSAAIGDLSSFINAGTLRKLSQREQAEAASAQYYALQFGRPGAPRLWQGDTGASGKVSVGPYVRVNTLDCREFTHVVTVQSESTESKGTACREADGVWSVMAG